MASIQEVQLARFPVQDRSYEPIHDKVVSVVLKSLQMHFKELKPYNEAFSIAYHRVNRDECLAFTATCPVRCWPFILPGTIVGTTLPFTCAPTPLIPILAGLSSCWFGCSWFLATSPWWRETMDQCSDRLIRIQIRDFEQAKTRLKEELGNNLHADLDRYNQKECCEVIALINHLADCSFCCEAVCESLYSGTASWNKIIFNLTDVIKKGNKGAAIAKTAGLTSYVVNFNQSRITNAPLLNLDKIYDEVIDVTKLPNVLGNMCVSYLGCSLEPVATGSFRADLVRSIRTLEHENSEEYGALCTALSRQ